MYLSITYKEKPATDLGYLLHKHPERVQTFSLSYGEAHVFYPEVSEERATAVLLMELDPVLLVRGRGQQGSAFTLDQYVNDRPYVASSFFSVALGQVYSSALAGRSKERSELVDKAVPLEATLSLLPARGGSERIERLFSPLGYEVEVNPLPLDESYPEWGLSPYVRLTLRGRVRLKDLLSHLYVLIPAIDHEKHYWVGEDEVEKLLRHGEEWLPHHPEREWITTRYLKYQRKLAQKALAEWAEPAELTDSREEQAEKPLRLNDIRLQTVAQMLRQVGATRVLDLGCGEGKLLRILSQDRRFEKLAGMDVSMQALQIARERLPEQVELFQGSLLYRDGRLRGYEAVSLVEVIEHIAPERLPQLEQLVFGELEPDTVIVTTPNREYNARFQGMAEGQMRHHDHRFEWTRAQFAAWAEPIAKRHGYSVQFHPVGPFDPNVGAPTQMAVFQRQTD
ncbi:3' terminal RNA ribose 2'-O-methyltransferase Hen1 [Laceyella putida]|uniref:Small RNA 2'-O-methyltransferase n=1 Tax=Laceyella putida TaxID=110101 RepID=A0ABW2RLD7_9BACL